MKSLETPEGAGLRWCPEFGLLACRGVKAYISLVLNHPSGSSLFQWCSIIQPCPPLCGPLDCSPPGSSVHGVLQARILEWGAISFSRDLPDPGIECSTPTLAGRFFTLSHLGRSPKSKLWLSKATHSFWHFWQITRTNQTKSMTKIKNTFQLTYYVMTEVEMEPPNEIMSKAW